MRELKRANRTKAHTIYVALPAIIINNEVEQPLNISNLPAAPKVTPVKKEYAQNSEFVDAAAAGRIEQVKQMVAQGVDVSSVDFKTGNSGWSG